MRVQPDPSNWSPYPNVWDEANRLIANCDWYYVYDTIEAIHWELRKIGDRSDNSAEMFSKEMNELFVEEGIGWKLEKGELVIRGDEPFEAGLQVAQDALGHRGLLTSQRELIEAVRDMSRRPEPDFTGAVHHAMASLECVAREVSGSSNATLGAIISRHSDLFPKPLDEAVKKIWGFASDTSRHVREGHVDEWAETQLVVGLSACLATYLSERIKVEM